MGVHSEQKHPFRDPVEALLLVAPVWSPVLFIFLAQLLHEFFQINWLFNSSLSTFGMFLVPAISALPLIHDSPRPLAIRLLLAGVYYLVGLAAIFLMSWGMLLYTGYT
ncbi:hypothetical protein FXN65_12240 [Metapseudomonas lalkuanensis]|uniref:Uncharacterized protein n=1 Tax=Metapseudomonas lalkuanensis TaxID=2604832 RepID=A0A5J6QJV7_9GAMM|nr:hypothetical protein [Pseudomonas lalkuanensis]QEY62804.1 hypothetical protein FXN65_12240 [Pseudomonas lalkuanensis]UCO95970.1 hypothetical protein LF844_14825 [Pseudomonas lalkuanensis]